MNSCISPCLSSLLRTVYGSSPLAGIYKMTDSSISTVYAWGCLNGRGAAQTYPLQMHGLSGENAMSCAAGTDHSLVLLSCGAVWVCGQADDCRSDVLRQGTSDSGMTFPMQQAKFDGARISSVAAGDSTSLHHRVTRSFYLNHTFSC